MFDSERIKEFRKTADSLIRSHYAIRSYRMLILDIWKHLPISHTKWYIDLAERVALIREEHEHLEKQRRAR